jgi:hypothetical protein
MSAICLSVGFDIGYFVIVDAELLASQGKLISLAHVIFRALA